MRAITEEKRGGLTQQELARRLDSRRSSVNRQLSGEAEITLRSLAELAWALDREISLELRTLERAAGQNIAPVTSTTGHKPIRIIGPRPPDEQRAERVPEIGSI
ncbi:helix-turn-helix domain-containing protein [Bradyrhizobium sp.]|uniref:helix-turn-helix domain-containing protein n=1 Tax=Bradyrhizobium sp. TaxID=376 RepID=UPI003C4C8407